MTFGWDDEVWKNALHEFFTAAPILFGLWLTYKLNRVAKTQVVNSGKIDLAAGKADMASQKASEAQKAVIDANIAKEAHLSEQDKHIASVAAKVEEVAKNTNGLLDSLVKKARDEGHESGERAALNKLIEQGKIKEH